MQNHMQLIREILKLKRVDAKFVVLVIFLTASFGMDIQNASATNQIGKKLDAQGDEIRDHSYRLKQIEDNFKVFVAYMDSQQKNNSEQAEKLDKLEKRLDKTEKKVDEIEKKVDKNSKKVDKGRDQNT